LPRSDADDTPGLPGIKPATLNFGSGRFNKGIFGVLVENVSAATIDAVIAATTPRTNPILTTFDAQARRMKAEN
jgi:hypothetical protein